MGAISNIKWGSQFLEEVDWSLVLWVDVDPINQLHKIFQE